MADAIISYLLVAALPLALKTGLYLLIFRKRKHRVSLLTCIILAGSPMLGAVIPLPLPPVVMMLAGFGIALYILSRYTEVPLFPEGLLTIVGVEILSGLIVYITMSLLYEARYQ